MLNVPASACRQRLLSFYSPNNGVELIGRPPTLCPGGSRGYPNGEQEKVRLHLTARFRFVGRTINFNPDHVSSIAHTLTSTNPSGSAAARTTSSVTSVATPEDFFGQDTQTIPVSATFSRKTGNLVANSLRFFMKTWTKLESGFKRSEKVTPSGFVPSK